MVYGSQMMNCNELIRKSLAYRKSILRMIYKADAGHIGGSLSCVDILNVLYNYVMNVSPGNFCSPDRDRYFHSKGHSSQALYAVLCDKGFFGEEMLDFLSQYQSELFGHPTRLVPGVEHNTGALGHGLSVGVGTALAGKMDQKHYHVFVMIGDGELAEGSNWEGMMAAAHYVLDNLVVILDRNTLQISGKTEEVMSLEPIEEKLQAFGFSVASIDGNSISELIEIFSNIPFEEGKPNMIIANTVKGKGISFMENQAKWHHRVPSEEEYKLAMIELEEIEKTLVADDV